MVLAYGSGQDIALVDKIDVTALGKIGDEAVWIRIITVGDAKDRARRTWDTGLPELALDCHLGAVGAFRGHLKRMGWLAKLEQGKENNTHIRAELGELDNAFVIDGEWAIRDKRKTAVATGVDGNPEGAVSRWNPGKYKAFGRGARVGARRSRALRGNRCRTR